MKRFYTRDVALMIAMLLIATCVGAQEKPVYDMGKMQMVFLTMDPERKPMGRGEIRRVGQKHRDYVNSLLTSGKCALAGPATGDGPIREILVFKVESTEEILELTKSFPAVSSGMMKADVIPWFAARNVITAPVKPLEPSNYIFGLLVRGPRWTPEKTPETEKIQEGHMANINRLAEAGKMVIAGPFYGDGDRRGVFVFKVNSIAEAQALTDTDPAVKAGRLKIELYGWSVPKGILK